LEKADNVNRRDKDKKAQQKEHTYRWDVKLTPFGTPSLIRRRMKVQLRNKMLVQCSSEFFVTLLIAADEDCLVQSKRTATKYIIYFSGIVNSFSPIIGNRIADLISFDIYI